MILPLGDLLAGLLEASWGVLEASWAVWRPSWPVLEASWAILAAWVGFLGRHGSLGELQGGAMAAQVPPGSRDDAVAYLRDGGGRPLRRLQKPCQGALGILPRLNVPRHGGGFSGPVSRFRALGPSETDPK